MKPDRTAHLAAALLGCGLLLGCSGTDRSSETIQTTAENVLTLQSGTVSELKERRGSGPFTTYDLSPGAMLEVLERALGRAGSEDEPPYVTVYVSERYGEVLAKEFGEPHKSYADPFRSAALAIVHPLRGEEERCRVEVHQVQRGPFHRGRVRWAAVPGWIDEAIADLTRIRPIPGK